MFVATSSAPTHRRMAPAELRAPGNGTLHGVWLLTLVSVVAWRQGVLYDGGLDAVVVLKALLQGVALVWAGVAFIRSRRRFPVGVRSLIALALIVYISCIGGIAGTNAAPDLILGVRVGILAATVVLLFRMYPAGRNLRCLFTSMAVLGLVSAATGLVLGGDERLSGGIPPLSPNEIAFLTGVPALALMHEVVRDRAGRRGAYACLLLAVVMVLTESRTSLVAAAVAAVLVLAHLRKVSHPTVVTLLVLAPTLYSISAYTPVVRGWVNRSDSASLLTLNSRTISWEAVARIPWDTWERWIGTGLATKQIQVPGQYWEFQVFDSSWVSALAQAGVVGLAVMIAWMAGGLWTSLRSPAVGSLTTPLLVFILIRSFMENGLVEAQPMFLVFLSLTLCVEAPSAGAHESWELHRPFAHPAEDVPAAAPARTEPAPGAAVPAVPAAPANAGPPH